MIDPAALNRLSEWGGPKLVMEMVRLFLENSVERMAQLARALEAGDADGVERSAHSLKASSANVGAVEVSRLAQDIERLAADGKVEEARALHGSLLAEHGKALRLLEDIERSGRGASPEAPEPGGSGTT